MHSIVLKRLKLFLGISAITVALIGILCSFLIQYIGVPPRSLAPYIERRGEGHNAIISGISRWMGRALNALDRSQQEVQLPRLARIGAQEDEVWSSRSTAFVVRVASTQQAVQAIARAQPGNVIILLPGTYRFNERPIAVNQPGTRTRHIIVRAEKPNTVFIEFGTTEGFIVSAPYWIFENLNIRGVCLQHSDCEHAFHVVGKGSFFSVRNNTITDFNAHIKINGLGNDFPDYGLIEQNTLTNSSVRQTTRPVTPIDLVAASHWTIRRNLITDFAKGQSDQISYGAFVKGGGTGNRLEQNIVLCESRLKHISGQRVGLSLGGGGTGKQFCRDQRCITEQDGSTIQSNLIAYCSDDGIYVNRSAASRILHNTLIDTGGIFVRFPESSADVHGNLVDGIIRSRDDALLRAEDNYQTSLMRLYLGWHPERARYTDAAKFELTWSSDPPRRELADDVPDLCASQRSRHTTYGAFEDFGKCLR